MFQEVNQVVAVGSVDGICTAAAVLRLTGNSQECGLVFAQAFTVEKVDVSAWAPGRQVAFVDLAVNNRDPKMTADFVRRIREAGHEIVAVIDEHSREDWLAVLGSFEGLIVEPQSQKDPGGPGSSGELLRRALERRCPDCVDGKDESGYGCGTCFGGGIVDDADLHTLHLLSDADSGDRMDFRTRYGGAVNQAVKSSIADDSRRVYLARHFAEHTEPNETIRGWIAEYEAILANHDRVVASRQDLGDRIVRVSATGLKVDMTTLMGTLYEMGPKVVVLEGESYSKALGRKVLQLSFGTRLKDLDLLGAVQAVVPSASGFAQKANVEPEHEAAAVEAVRAALRSRE